MVSEREKYLSELDDVFSESDNGVKEEFRGKKIGDLKRYYRMFASPNTAIRSLREGGKYILNRLKKGTDDFGDSLTREDVEKRSKEGFGAAYNLMKRGETHEDLLLGAELYTVLGKKEKALRRLIKSTKRLLTSGNLNKQHYQEIREFIEENASDEPSSGLEGRVGVFALSIIAGIAISVSSLSSTGYVVGGLFNNSLGLLGTFLFVFGIVGLAFSLKE